MSLHPNMISMIGLLPPILFFVLLTNGMPRTAFLTLFLFIFDAIDGAVARSTGKTSKFGGVLDSTLDRLADALLITAFAFANIITWELSIATLIFAYLVSYIRSRAELAGGGKFKLNVGIAERTERIILAGVGLLLWIIYPNNIAYGINIAELIFIILIITLFITVIQRLLAAKNLLE